MKSFCRTDIVERRAYVRIVFAQDRSAVPETVWGSGVWSEVAFPPVLAPRRAQLEQCVARFGYDEDHVALRDMPPVIEAGQMNTGSS